MDVQRWLHATADRAPPDASDDPPVPTFLRSPGEADKPTRKYHRKRKRAASDSSIIPQQQHSHQPAGLDRSANKGRRFGRTRHSESFARSLDSGSPYAGEKRSLSQGSDPGGVSRQSPNPYERRARHKTKADRYEAKKKRGRQKEDEKHRDRKLKQRQRKSHRIGDGGRTARLVQSFQLKNGPKNHRLTLKPENNAGLFKHGRASAQLAGRGKGLPDLVFNEMRFLVRPDEHQDEIHPEGAKREQTAKDRKRQLENGEISNYFNAHQGRPDSKREDRVSTQQRRISTPARPVTEKTRRRATPEGSPSLDEAELSGVPYLGLGTRGAVHHSSQPAHQSTSYLPWSETPPIQSGHGGIEHRTSAARQSSRLISPQYDRAQDLSRHKSMQIAVDQGLGVQGAPTRPREPKLSKSGRTSTEADADELLKESRRSRGQPQHIHTSQHLPKHPTYTSAYRPPESGRNSSVRPSEAESYRTSEILKVRDKMQALVEEPWSRPHQSSRSSICVQSPRLQRSTSISRLLQNAQQAVRRYEAAGTHKSADHKRDGSRHHELVARSISRNTSDNPSQHTWHNKQINPALQRISERFWHPAMRPPTSTTQSIRHPPGMIWRQPSVSAVAVADEADDDEMLDNAPDANRYLTGIPDGTTDYDIGPHEHLKLGTMPIPHTDPHQSAGGTPFDEPFAWPRSSTHSVPTALRQHFSAARESRQPGMAVQALYKEDDLEDFWQPNRLF